MPERTFNNIINISAGSNTALEAVNAIIAQLKVLQTVAYETGMALDAALARGAAGGAAPGAAAGGSPEERVKSWWQRFVGGITRGGVEVSGAGAGMGAGIRLPASLATLAGKTFVTPEEYAMLQAAGITEMPAAELDPDTVAKRITRRVGEFPFKREPVYTGVPQDVTAYRLEGEEYLARKMESTRRAMGEGGYGGPKGPGGVVSDWSDEGIKKFGDSVDDVTNRVERSRRGFLSHARSIVEGMLVWQALNTVMNAVITTIDKTIDETARLDQTSAKLATTLGVTKEAALAQAQAITAMGIAYGLMPAESQALGLYAARVQKAPAAREELTRTAAMLGARTGEDPLKLMDDLNVAYRQTGISVSQLGDMAVRAFSESGTSASEYINMIREIGPLAKSTGIDIEKAAAVMALSADRMGGSLSDAANTWTRLSKAVTEPTPAQLSVLNRYQIPIGDVEQALDLISKANMTAQELATLGGRPGMPQVANDVRTMISVYKEYNGALERGPGLQEQFATSVDNLADANKRLKASWETLLQSFGIGFTTLIGGSSALDTLTYKITGLADAIKKGEWGRLTPQYLFQGGLMFDEEMTRRGRAIVQGAAGEGTTVSSATGGAARGGEQWYNQLGFAAFPQPMMPTAPRPTMTALQMMQMQAAQAITEPMDVTKYSAAQIEAAKSRATRITDEWIKSQGEFYDALGIPPDKKAEAMQAVKEMSDKAVIFIKDISGNITAITGAQALNFQAALREAQVSTAGLKIGGADWTKYSDEEIRKAAAMVPQYQRMQQEAWRFQLQQQGVPAERIAEIIAEKMREVMAMVLPVTRGMGMTTMTGPMAAFMPETLMIGSRTQALEDRLADLRRALEDLNETETKRAQLEGMWNIPAGAKLLVPLTAESQALIKEHGGETEDQARERRRNQILREIAETEAKLAAEKAKDAQLLAMLNSQQQGSNAATIGLQRTGQAGLQTAAALNALRERVQGAIMPGPSEAERARERVAGAIEPAARAPTSSEMQRERVAGAILDSALGKLTDMMTRPQPQITATTPYGPTLTTVQSNVILRAIPMNVTVQSTAIMDSEVVARLVQRHFTRDLVYEATASGTYTQ